MDTFEGFVRITGNRILELADISKADFIITGNTNDFTMKTHNKTKIVSPKEYWEKFK